AALEGMAGDRGVDAIGTREIVGVRYDDHVQVGAVAQEGGRALVEALEGPGDGEQPEADRSRRQAGHGLEDGGARLLPGPVAAWVDGVRGRTGDEGRRTARDRNEPADRLARGGRSRGEHAHPDARSPRDEDRVEGRAQPLDEEIAPILHRAPDVEDEQDVDRARLLRMAEGFADPRTAGPDLAFLARHLVDRAGGAI